MTATQAITAVAGNLKSHPVAFAIVVINALFLVAAVWVLGDVATNARERAEAMQTLLTQCVGKVQEQKNVR